MTIKNVKPALVFILLSGILLITSCETGLKKEMEPAMKDLKSISVYPFVCVDCPLPIRDDKNGNINENASQTMTDYLIEKLQKKDGLEVSLMPALTKEDVEGLYSGAKPIDHEKVKEAVLVGRIYSYKDRKGGNYSVSEPSRVSFDMRIIRVSDGKVLFLCDFDEVQKPLLSNILNIGTFLKRKGRWVKADEMALNAIDEALEDYFNSKP